MHDFRSALDTYYIFFLWEGRYFFVHFASSCAKICAGFRSHLSHANFAQDKKEGRNTTPHLFQQRQATALWDFILGRIQVYFIYE